MSVSSACWASAFKTDMIIRNLPMCRYRFLYRFFPDNNVCHHFRYDALFMVWYQCIGNFIMCSVMVVGQQPPKLQ